VTKARVADLQAALAEAEAAPEPPPPPPHNHARLLHTHRRGAGNVMIAHRVWFGNLAILGIRCPTKF